MALDPSARLAASTRVRRLMTACPLLADVPQPALEATMAQCWVRSLATDEALFRAGDPPDAMFVIESGTVVARITSERGDVADVAVAGPPELIGYPETLDKGPRACDAIAVEPASVVVIPARAVEKLLRSSPRTVCALAAAVVGIVRMQCDATARMFESAPVRLAALLLDAAGDADRLTLGGPQALFAQRIGVTRQTLNRALHALADQGLVTLAPGGRSMTLHRAGLATFAKRSPFRPSVLSSR